MPMNKHMLNLKKIFAHALLCKANLNLKAPFPRNAQHKVLEVIIINYYIGSL